MIAIDLIKQQTLDADPEAIQLPNFTGNIDREVSIVFVGEKVKQTIFLKSGIKK